MRKIFLITFIFLSFVLLASCGSTKKRRTTETINTKETSKDESSNKKKNESSKNNESKESEKSSSESKNKESESDKSNSNESTNSSDIKNSDVETTTNESIAKHTITFTYNVYSDGNIVETSNNGKEFGTITQTQAVNDGTNLSLSVDLKDGYSFGSWFLGGKRLSTSSNYTLTNIKEDLEIECRLKYQNYNIKIINENPNVGSVSINNIEYEDDVTYDFEYNSSLVISTDGDESYLNGFYLNGELLSDQASFEFVMPANNVEITLLWDIYSITYDLNDGDSNSASNPTSYVATDDEITLLYPSYTGYEFLGWYDENDNKIETIDPASKKNYKLKAKWVECENTAYNVQILLFDYDLYEFVLDEEKSYTSYGKTGSLTEVEYNDITGYIKDSNSVTQKTIDRFGDTVIQLKYRPVWKSITLLFEELYTGRVNKKESGYYGESVSFTAKMADEYKFKGVYDSLDYDANQLIDGTSLTFDLNIEAEDKTYYIKAEKCAHRVNTYQELINDPGFEITFDANGGIFEDTVDELITQSSNNLLYKIPTKYDALFTGWYSSKFASSRTYLNKYFTEDTTLYAKWIESDKWKFYGIDYENITLGYVNRKYEICENEYPSNTSYYGAAFVFSPLAAGKVRIFISGAEYDSLTIYQLKNGDVTEIKYINDGNYIETSSNLSVGNVYYVLVDGEHGFTYGIDIRGAYPDDFRDFTSTSVNSTTNKIEKYGNITVLKNELCQDEEIITLDASTNYDEDSLIGYDNIFLGWYDSNNNLVSTDYEFDYFVFYDVNLTAKWGKVEYKITNDMGYDSLVSYELSANSAPYRVNDFAFVELTPASGIQIDEIEYDGIIDDNPSTSFLITLKSNIIEMKLYISYKNYSFSISGDVSNVNLNGTYDSEYEYNSGLTISVTNESGHTLKWLKNGIYLTYGDSFDITILEDISLTYELANIDIVDGYAYYGSYPQSKVTDDALLTNLNSLITVPSSYKSKSSTLPSGWYDFGYWSYSADYSGYRTSVYTDKTYNGEKYRAIYIYYYRQDDYVGGTSKTTYQKNSGYDLNTIYWFKFESIKWNILNVDDDGNMSLLAANSIDSTHYCKNKNSDPYSHNGYTAYPTSYEASDIRIWLNNYFYNLAFDTNEKNLLNINTVSGEDEDYSPNSTEDYVYILSRAEVNNYSLNVENDGTDYAVAQGYDTSVKASWTRTPYSNNLMYKTLGSMPAVYNVYVGVRPVINVSI